MRKRIVSVAAQACFAVLLCSAFAPRLFAQEAQPPPLYTYVALWGVPRAQWGEMQKLNAQAQPILEKLAANGTLEGWGNCAYAVHDENGFTHCNWFSASSIADVMKALDALAPVSASPVLNDARHVDELLRSSFRSEKGFSINSGYMIVANYMVRPDREDAFLALTGKFIKPWLDSLVADGTIAAYSVESQVIHTSTPGSYDVVLLFKDAAGIDQYYKRFDTLLVSNPLLVGSFLSVVDFSKHRDILLRVSAEGK